MKTWIDFEKVVKTVNSEEEFRDLEISSEFSAKLINERLKRNLTQKDLASLCGMKQSAIARIENGTLPRIDTVYRIAKALNTAIEFIPLDSAQPSTDVKHLEDKIQNLENTVMLLTKQIEELITTMQPRNNLNITIDKSPHYVYSDYLSPSRSPIFPIEDYAFTGLKAIGDNSEKGAGVYESNTKIQRRKVK